MIPTEERNKIIATVHADNGFMKEFVGDFLADVHDDVQAIENALQKGDHTRMERLAHSLKSVVGFFKASTTFEMAKELEALGREGNLEDGALKLEELKASLEELKRLLVSTL